MGKRRESNSPDGPPPTNVKFDPSSFRRRSDPVRRSIAKRSAVEQPPGESSPKRARGPFYSPSLEAITEDIPDSEAWGVVRLQLRLHTLGAELAQRKPAKANEVLKRQVDELEDELEQARTRIEGQKRHQEKNKKPKGSKA